jgi:hypothetical protein
VPLALKAIRDKQVLLDLKAKLVQQELQELLVLKVKLDQQALLELKVTRD